MSLPVGTVISYMGQASSIPALHNQGWLVCDGSIVAIIDYQSLYRAIGGAYGQPSEDTFNLPDLRGMVLRGIDTGGVRGPDGKPRTDPDPSNPTAAGPVAGSIQGQQLHSHRHDRPYDSAPISDGGDDTAVQLAPNCPSMGNASSAPTTDIGDGGDETRPVNSDVYFLILARSQS